MEDLKQTVSVGFDVNNFIQRDHLVEIIFNCERVGFRKGLSAEAKTQGQDKQEIKS